MRNPPDAICELENLKIKDKAILLKEEIQESNLYLFTGFYCALNPHITFGVKKIPEKKVIENSHELFFPEFFENLKKLATRELSTNDAKELINSMMERSSTHMWNNFYRRILTKNMKCGVTIDLINSCAKELDTPGYLIPKFSYQSTIPYSRMINLSGEIILQPKVNGERIFITIYPNKLVQLFNKHGTELTQSNEIKNELISLAEDINVPMMFDGIITFDSQKLVLFDTLPLGDFEKGQCQISQRVRLVNLQLLPLMRKFNYITIIPYVLLNYDEESGKTEFNRFLNECIDTGYNGMIIKNANSEYTCSKNSNWMSIDLNKIIELYDIEFIEENNKLISLIGYALDNNGKSIKIVFDSELTEEEKDNFINKKKNFVDKFLIVRYYTRYKKNDHYRLLFPKFYPVSSR